jgi:hypothetical protein
MFCYFLIFTQKTKTLIYQEIKMFCWSIILSDRFSLKMSTRDTQTVNETKENCSQTSTSNSASLCKISLESQEHLVEFDHPLRLSKENIQDLSLSVPAVPKASSPATTQQTEMKTEGYVQINQGSIDSSLTSNSPSFLPFSTPTKSRKRKRNLSKNETKGTSFKNENLFIVMFFYE